MATFDYSEMAALSASLIEEFGRTATFIELGDVAANPAQPWLGAANPRGAPKQTLERFIVMVEPESSVELGQEYTAFDFLKRSQKIVLVYSETLLEPFDELLDNIDGSRWKIQGMSRLRPGSTDLLWFVGVSR